MWLSKKKRIRNHLETHSVLSDEDFLAALKVAPEQYDICLAIRNTAAEFLEVPPGTLYPSDSMDYLNKLGFDISSFILELEPALSIDIDYEAFARIVSDREFVDPSAFADLIRFFKDHLDSFTASP
jgi:hypothetical protein